MAKKITSENLHLNIIINGDQGRMELANLGRTISDLKKKNKELTESQKEVYAAMDKLRRSGKENSQEFRNLEKRYSDYDAEVSRNNSTIDAAKKKITELRSKMDLTKRSISELREEQIRLRKLLKMSVPGTEQFDEYKKALGLVEKQLRKTETQAKLTKSGFCEMAETTANTFISSYGAFYTIVNLAKPFINAVEKFSVYSDVLADARKTTGLTSVEIDKMSESLSKLDTRTSQEDLMGLVRIAGKLGIEGSNNIEGFTRAADQLVVALKEDLGGDAEESIRLVGKIVDIFGLKDSLGIEKAMLSVGSAINELGAASTANEGYIVEFTNRVAGVAPLVNVSAQDVMGLAATLDQFGQTAEVSSTVYSQLMTKMFSNTSTYANIAGMSLRDFTELLNKDANEAFIRLLEGINGNEAGMQGLVSALGDMGLEGKRVVGVLGVLSKNTQQLRNQQKLSNDSFREATSLTNEFNIKNTNAAAQLDKSKKKLREITIAVGKELNPTINIGYSFLGFLLNAIKPLLVLLGFLAKNFISVSATVITYAIALNKSIATDKLKFVWTNKLKKGLGDLFKTIVKNPFAALLASLVALVAVLAKTAKSTDTLSKAINRAKKASKDAELEIENETQTINRLFGALKGAKEGSEEYFTAKKAIIDQYDQYLSGMTDEVSTFKDIEAAQRAVTVAVMASIRAKTLAEKSRDADLAYANKQFEIMEKIRKAMIHQSGDEKGSEMFVRFREEYASQEGLSEEMNRYIDKFDHVAYGDVGVIDRANKIRDLHIKSLDIAKAIYDREIKDLNDLLGKTKAEIDAEQAAADAAKKAAELKAEQERQASIRRQKEEEEKRIRDEAREYINSLLSKNKTEDELHEERLRKAGLFGKERHAMTEVELQAYEILMQEHEKNIADIKKKGAAAINELLQGELQNIKDKQQVENTAARIEALNQQQKLQGLYTEFIKSMRQRQSDKLKSFAGNEQNRLDLIEQFQEEEKQLFIEYATKKAELLEEQGVENRNRAMRHTSETMKLIQGILDGTDLSLAFDITSLSDNQVEDLKKQLDELRLAFAQLAVAAGDAGLSPSEPESSKRGDTTTVKEKSKRKTDILGMSPEDWNSFQENLKAGKLGIEELQTAAAGLSALWQSYNSYMDVTTRNRVKQYEDEADKKKKALARQLEDGLLSYKDYNSQVATIEDELAARKEMLEDEQAKRDKALGIFNAVINTAVGISSALKLTPPASFILAGLTAAMGAAQIATIASAQYATGRYPIIGKDDGKIYDARYVPELRTDIYDTPSIGLFSEKEPEMVVDGATTRRMVMKYPEIYRSIIEISRGRAPQYSEGRYPEKIPAPYSNDVFGQPAATYYDTEIKQLLKTCIQTMVALQKKELYVSLYGKNGLIKTMKKAERYEKLIKK